MILNRPVMIVRKNQVRRFGLAPPLHAPEWMHRAGHALAKAHAALAAHVDLKDRLAAVASR
jgi:hypothetical protein